MNRRGFLRSILAAGIAPYVVTTTGVLMPVKKVLTFTEAPPGYTRVPGYEPYIDFKGPWGEYLNPITGEWGVSRVAMPDYIAYQRNVSADYRRRLDVMPVAPSSARVESLLFPDSRYWTDPSST